MDETKKGKHFAFVLCLVLIRKLNEAASPVWEKVRKKREKRKCEKKGQTQTFGRQRQNQKQTQPYTEHGYNL